MASEMIKKMENIQREVDEEAMIAMRERNKSLLKLNKSTCEVTWLDLFFSFFGNRDSTPQCLYTVGRTTPWHVFLENASTDTTAFSYISAQFKAPCWDSPKYERMVFEENRGESNTIVNNNEAAVIFGTIKKMLKDIPEEEEKNLRMRFEKPKISIYGKKYMYKYTLKHTHNTTCEGIMVTAKTKVVHYDYEDDLHLQQQQQAQTSS